MSKNQEPIINVPEIKKRIGSKHKKFLKDFGFQVEKVIAEQKLQSDIMIARLFRIALCFKEEDIIDSVTIIEEMPLKKMTITKSGYDNYITLTTNGNAILMIGFGQNMWNSFESDTKLVVHRFENIQNKNYNWIEFADALLDCIHSVIYERKEAAESKIDGIFKEK